MPNLHRPARAGLLSLNPSGGTGGGSKKRQNFWQTLELGLIRALIAGF